MTNLVSDLRGAPPRSAEPIPINPGPPRVLEGSAHTASTGHVLRAVLAPSRAATGGTDG